MAYRVFSIEEIKQSGYEFIMTIPEYPTKVIMKDVARIKGYPYRGISCFRIALPEVYGIFYRPDDVPIHFPTGELILEYVGSVLENQKN